MNAPRPTDPLPHFRGEFAAASLKHIFAADLQPPARYFRGEFAAASLKLKVL